MAAAYVRVQIDPEQAVFVVEDVRKSNSSIVTLLGTIAAVKCLISGFEMCDPLFIKTFEDYEVQSAKIVPVTSREAGPSMVSRDNIGQMVRKILSLSDVPHSKRVWRVFRDTLREAMLLQDVSHVDYNLVSSWINTTLSVASQKTVLDRVTQGDARRRIVDETGGVDVVLPR